MAITDNLISYFNLDDGDGTTTRADSVGGNTLTNNNSVSHNANGPGTHGASHFTRSSSQSLSVASNSALQTGDIDFTIAGWVFFDSKVGVGSWQVLFGKDPQTPSREWNVWYFGTDDRLEFNVFPAGDNTTVTIKADTLGSPAISTWYFVVAWHDSVANTINIQVNNGATDAASHSAGVFSSTGPFRIGANQNVTNFWDGRIALVGFWKRVLTSAEITFLYNAGSGRSYAELAQARRRRSRAILYHHYSSKVRKWIKRDSGLLIPDRDLVLA